MFALILKLFVLYILLFRFNTKTIIMKTAIGTLFFTLFFVLTAKTQNITINEDPIISKMMLLFIGRANPTPSGTTSTTPATGINTPIAPQIIDGFRIQILASTDRRQVESGQSSFAARYPSTYVTWQQAKPYYRLRVGAFASRSDATRYLQNIRRDYPDAYIVPDKVKTNEITN